MVVALKPELLNNGRNVEKREWNAVRMERKVLMSRLMLELRISVEQERICLRHLDSVSLSQLSPRYSGHEWLSVWIWELSVEGENRVWWGSLCVSTCGDER